ncbi:hypothetical protein M514_02064 [Trichuris suis]|uniref:Uncharacterized protein n=1 Tax=Trichuris suis TaxID=68888 RepID=A0A085MIY3_9BILA|nr:hypothetical protein M513_02064 [Trichuris suis]KFD63378.1 hypothetical protein M514_02064 [Trichuris suis]
MTKLSLQLDESTLPGNEALLLAYVRNCFSPEGLLTDTKGVSIFCISRHFFEEKLIPLTNITSIATDGALSIEAWFHCAFEGSCSGRRCHPLLNSQRTPSSNAS